MKLHPEIIDGKKHLGTKYYVWDTETNDYVLNRTFSFYDSKEECQKDIDLWNSINVLKVMDMIENMKANI